MNAQRRSSLVVLLVLALPAASAWGQTPVAPAVEAMLVQGKLADAQRQLEGQLQSDAKDDNARFALGIVQTLQGGERLMQALYYYGLNPRWANMLPFVRLPVPLNPKPEPLTNDAFRKIIADFADDLAKVEATLAAIGSADVKLPMHLGMVRLDFDGDGQAGDEETLWRIFSRVTGRDVSEETAAGFVMALDKGDVHWLRGYCRLLSALCEMHLTYDTQELHDHAARLFFPTAEAPYPFLGGDDLQDWIFDAIAFIHMLQLPVVAPERMAKAHEHLLAVVEQSRLSWAAILAETDDDREWVPNPQQKNTAIPGAVITKPMVDGWHAVLDEVEAILQGKKLVPFWRRHEGRGVNMQRVFMEPTEFDLVLWVQGTAAAPYLEKGEVTSPDFWNRIRTGFQGQFFWFAIWVN
ncbi:MAG: hypothetical protein H0T51_18505 [Pirellulales bacterium]|nr:hypothetical protein [Pirellulales bacterium]